MVNSVMSKYKKLILLFLALVLCVSVVSCSTAKKVKNMVYRSSEPKKKIGFIGIANRTEYEMQDYAKSIQDLLYARLGKSSDLLVMSPEELKSAGFNPPITRNLAELEPYMSKAKELGLNALVKGDISELEVMNELRGIYGFRKEKPTLNLILRAQLIDVESRTVLYEGYKRADLALNLQEGVTVKEYIAQRGEIPIHFVTDMVKDMGGDMVDVMADQPWKSYIIKVESGKVQFAAGKDVDVPEGSLMEVWSQGDEIKNFAGQSFLMPGEKIGMVRCESVGESKTVSEVVQGGNFQLGDVVGIAD